MKTVALLSRPTPTSARLVAELYALFGVAWIWISHRASGSNPAPATPAGGLLHDHLALLNPLGFVAVSALALHLLLRAANRRYEAAHRAELSAASRYRALLDTSLDAIHVLDSEGRLIEANRAFYLSLGHDPGRPPELMVADWDARWTPKELRAKIAALMDRSEVFETIHRRRDGGSFEAEVSATGIEFEGRRLLVCVARDLTGRRQLQRAQLRAERLESLGLLAGGVAHDLNNALSPIILGADLFRARHRDAAGDPLIESIASAAQRGAGVLRQLLTFARGIEGERLPVAVRPLLTGLARLAEDGSPGSLRVELSFAPELPAVSGDSAQLHQVLLSLVLNARDAMPRGGVLTLGARPRLLGDDEAARLPGARPGPHLEIFVRDTGPGLDAQAREHLFEPFFTTKPRGQGTGLGLSTALGIVRSHGGTIEHATPPRGGAEFRVLLPAAEPGPGENGRHPAPKEHDAPRPTPPQDGGAA